MLFSMGFRDWISGLFSRRKNSGVRVLSKKQVEKLGLDVDQDVNPSVAPPRRVSIAREIPDDPYALKPRQVQPAYGPVSESELYPGTSTIFISGANVRFRKNGDKYEVYGRVTLVPGKGRINEVTAQFRTKQEREEWSGHLAEHFSVPKEHIETHIIFK